MSQFRFHRITFFRVKDCHSLASLKSLDKRVSVTHTKQSHSMQLLPRGQRMCVIIVLSCIRLLTLTNYCLNGVSGEGRQGKYGTVQHN